MSVRSRAPSVHPVSNLNPRAGSNGTVTVQSKAHTRAAIRHAPDAALEAVDVAQPEHHVGLLPVVVGPADVVRDAVGVDPGDVTVAPDPGRADEVHGGLEVRQRVDHPLRELGAGAPEHVVVVGAVGVVARRHQLGVEAVGAPGQVLHDVADLLAREQVVDRETAHRRSAVLGADPQELLERAVQVDDAALLGRRDREVREPGLVQPALRAREVADVLVEHEPERRVGIGREQRVERLRPRRRRPVCTRVNANTSMNASSTCVPGRARTTESMSANTSTVMFGNRLYCSMSSTWWSLYDERSMPCSRFTSRTMLRQHPAERVALGDGRHRARRGPRTPMRAPITSTNDANTSSSPPGRPWRGDGRPYDCTSRPWRCQITCGPLTSSAMPSISRWMPCTWYVSLKPSMSVFQLQSAPHRDQRLAAELVEVGPRGLGRDRVEELAERLGVGVEVHEDHRTPGVDLHGDEREVVVEDAELAPRRHLAQAAVEVPRPAVERAADLGQVGARAAAQLAAAVAAHVLERAQDAVVAAHDQHRDRARCGTRASRPGVRDVVDGARELPGASATRRSSRARRTRATCSATPGSSPR